MGAAAESVFTFLFKYPPRLFRRGDLLLAPVVPAPALALAFLVALVLVVLTYRRLRGVSPGDAVLLGGWRALTLAIVLACLLRPMLVLSMAVAQRNVLAVLLDDSRSMRLADVDGRSRTSALNDPKALEQLQGGVIEGLKDFEFSLYRRLGLAGGKGPLLGARAAVPEEYRAAVERSTTAHSRDGRGDDAPPCRAESAAG